MIATHSTALCSCAQYNVVNVMYAKEGWFCVCVVHTCPE